MVIIAGETIEKIIYDIEAKIDKAIDGFQKVEKAMDGADKKASTSSKAMEKAANLVAKAWQYVALAVAAAITMIAKATIQSSADMEAYMITLTNLYGDLDTAGAKMEWLLDFAQKTPFELPGLIDAMTKLKAYGIEFESVIGSLGNAASALGKPLDMAVEALSDAQTGEFERLKEFGVKAVEITKKNYEMLGATQADVGLTALTYTDSQMQQAIKVIDRNNRAGISSAITSIFDEKYMGGMEALASSAKGVWSNIWDSLYKGQIAFMGFDNATKTFREGSLFDRMKTGLQGVLSAISNIDFEKTGRSVETFLGWMDKGEEMLQPWIDQGVRVRASVMGIAEDIGEAFGTKAVTDLSGLKLLLHDAYIAFLLVEEGVTRLYEYADAHDLGKYLVYPLRLTAEAASLTYIAIRDKLVKALDFMIEKYNGLVPMLQKAGVDAEVISMDMFKPLENSAKTAHEEVKKEMDQMAADQKAAVDEMTGVAKSADIIPGKRASYAQIMGVDAAAAAGLSGVYGSAGIPAANIPTSRIPAAQPLTQATSGPVQTGQQQQVSKYTEILKQMIESTNNIIKTLKEEPRTADISIKMDIETSMDVKKFERTTLQAVSDGVRGKAKVV